WVEVRDRGVGIPATQRAEALRRFGRLDPSRTGFGAGLGLSLVQAVARLHGGTIELGDAKPGLIIRLSIPL
ncbi:MAG: ATP-binding protein, partial [Sphingomonadaceae bacterium]|nr:ATP-binding protein [Sphingomonadaceae bacterium]